MKKLTDALFMLAALVIIILLFIPCLILAGIDYVRRVEDEPIPEPLQRVYDDRKNH
ncbi:hypothetical protein [Dyadobacter sp. CY323]|uniref:hypothetical protein n=1 Tax=Dyadobacter sp. CY323 TaxID=2907302 RepID=UPI001F2B3BA2|nr:hypothetical protein [Dyadobacter sp. CY323]MCE6993110.1 hypothetical protein [Dyadobacter sp. CY323]